MLSFGAFSAILYGSISGIVIVGAIVLLKIPLTRLVRWLETVFDFKPVRNIGDNYVVIDVCDDRFELTTTIWSRLPFVFALGTCILVILLVFIEGCIFSTRHFYSKKECSTRTPNCYLFKSDYSSFRPLYNFTCEPDLPVIPSNMSASYAVCYGYVLPDQSSTDILNQLGVCTGLLELVRYLYPLAYKSGREKIGRSILVLLLAALVILEVVVLSMQVNVTFVTIVLITLGEVLMINIFVLHFKRMKTPLSLSRVGSYIPLIEVN